ncbi:MAG: ASCH domain-containing protein [Vicinamibacterales bacterium]|nr:ASCH domain-containing protein [Vicinamibacterales bacterium]
MKALTIHQPWAELIARGDKPIENRTWSTSYRGALLIHASRSREDLFGWGKPEERVYGFPLEAMAFGAVVAVARLVECLALNASWPAKCVLLRTHEHARGPWCWVLEGVRRLPEPIPCRGYQQLWVPDDAVTARVREFMAVPR